METTKIISPYFENGAFAGVRVCVGDEDFVIAPKDYNDGKEMTWHYMMYVLEENKLETIDIDIYSPTTKEDTTKSAIEKIENRIK